jgi:hypothetical protein
VEKNSIQLSEKPLSLINSDSRRSTVVYCIKILNQIVECIFWFLCVLHTLPIWIFLIILSITRLRLIILLLQLLSFLSAGNESKIVRMKYGILQLK